MRISREQAFMMNAETWAMRSTCFRLNVGAIIVKDDNIVGIGYNGAPPGADHCTGNACPGVTPGGCPTVHAEQNAIRRAGSHTRGASIFCTDSPCEACCDHLKAAGISRVYFRKPYRVNEHLRTAGFDGVFQVTPAGYVVDFLTGKVLDVP